MRCENCGRDVPPESEFCQWCGSSLMARASAEWAEGDRSPGRAARRKPARFTLFNPRGRLNRLKYFYAIALYWVAYAICAAGLPYYAWSYGGAWMGAALVIILLLNFALLIISAIKRFHDLGEPGVNVLFMFVPFYNIYIGIKLLFFESATGINAYGENDGNGHYWQAPLVMLLAPVLILFGSTAYSFGPSYMPAAAEAPTSHALYTPRPTPKPTPAEPMHYYNAQYSISMDFPGGWQFEEMEGYVKAAYNADETQGLLLEVGDASDIVPFSDYSEANFTSYKLALMNKDKFAEDFGFDKDSILSPIIFCDDRYINGYRYVQTSFQHRVGFDTYWHYYIFGIYDGKVIVIQFLASALDGESAVDDLLACVDTFRFGDNAEP